VSFLLHNVLHFSRLLHAAGLDVHAGRTLDVAQALAEIDVGRRENFYFTLRTLLIHRQQDLAPFDEAFRLFWRPPSGTWTTDDLRALADRRTSGTPRIEVQDDTPRADRDDDVPLAAHTTHRIAPTSYSANEVSRVKDFAEFSDAEMEQARALLATLTWDLGMRRTRRWVAARRGAVDLKHIIRRNVRFGGEPVVLPARVRREKRRPLILLCDVSGSMERYARMLLQFIAGLAGGFAHVEAFVFATRLTRITREVKQGRSGPAVTTIPSRIPDWSGGTRIGEALRTLHVRWGNRVLRHGPVVLLISDGWDRGDPDVLRREMGRLQRSSYRLIWLNPLLGSPEYEPLTRGMQAALPFVDDFLPVHNLASLHTLADHLNRLPARRVFRPAWATASP
jgi:uncharacterized protein with von Willebrand factor type A (vWA) domain